MFFHEFTRTPIAEDSGPDQFVGFMYIKGTAPDPQPQYVIDTDPIVSLNYYSKVSFCMSISLTHKKLK